MATLPNIGDQTASTITTAERKSHIEQIRQYLQDLLGQDGTASTARSNLDVYSKSEIETIHNQVEEW